MINYCKTCKHEGEEIGVCSICLYNHILDERGIPPTQYEKKPSNADRIRSMTDEELARFLDNHGSLWGADIVSTANDWLDWLRKEVTDG